mgnify:CR=1 FL=1
MKLLINIIVVQKVPDELIGLDGTRRFFNPGEIKRKADLVVSLLGPKKGINREYFIRDSEDGGFEIVVESELEQEEEKAFQEKAVKSAQARASLVVENASSDNPEMISLPEQMIVDSSREDVAEIKDGKLLVATEQEAEDLIAIQNELRRGPLMIGDRVFQLDEKLKFFQVDSQTSEPQEMEIVLMALDYADTSPQIKVSEVLADGSFSKPVSAVASPGAITHEHWIAMVEHLKLPPEDRDKMRVRAKVARRFEAGRSQKVLKKITITEILSLGS